MARPLPLLLVGVASLGFSERFLLLFGDWGDAGALFSEGFDGLREGAWPRAGCCCACAVQLLFFLLLRCGEWGCGVGGWLRMARLEIKSSSMKASTAYEEATEGGLRTTKSSDRGEIKARSLRERDETLQTISSSAEAENTDALLPLGGESNSKD